MPVPDRFAHAHDWEYCEMCGECRARCGTEGDYERYCTDKVFNMKLGRVVRNNGKQEET